MDLNHTGISEYPPVSITIMKVWNRNVMLIIKIKEKISPLFPISLFVLLPEPTLTKTSLLKFSFVSLKVLQR